ncbi:hypothetical protein ACWGR4_01600 [Embleya sp. NPDC055664]
MMFVRRARRFVARMAAGCRALLVAGVFTGLVIGVPWMLVRCVGDPNPWPGGWGSPSEAWDRLSAPIDDEVLIRLLASIAWICWTAFVVDSVVELAWYVRRLPALTHQAGARAVHTGHLRELPPYRAVAALVIGGLILAVLATWRTASATATSPASMGGGVPPGVVAAASYSASESQAEVATWQRAPAATRRESQGAFTSYTVQPGDTLWLVAKARLGDPLRWPEIYRLSKEVVQEDGASLIDPDLIYPGWTLHVPASSSTSTPATPPESSGSEPSQSADESVPSRTPPSVSAPPNTSVPIVPDSGHARSSGKGGGHGFTVTEGTYVGLGLVGAITALAFTVRLRRRRQYEPGSGRRDDLTMAPIVRAMRHTYEELASPASIAVETEGSEDPAVAARSRAEAFATRMRTNDAAALGTQDGDQRTLDIFQASGLGLYGEGAAAATRALVTGLLAERRGNRPPGIEVLIPMPDARALFGDSIATWPRPSRLHLTPDAGSALDLVEAQIRAHSGRDLRRADIDSRAGLVLVVSPTRDVTSRLEELLVRVAPGRRVAGVVLGRWSSGHDLHVQRDGTVSSGTAGDLIGTRLFTLGSNEARALLTLLHEAEDPSLPRPRRSRPREGIENADEGPEEPVPAKVDGGSRVSDSSGSIASPTRRESTSEAPAEPVARPGLNLIVLGRIRLEQIGSEGRPDLTAAFAPKQLEILVYLSLHPDGVRVDSIAADMWPTAPSGRPSNSFHATLSQLRRSLRRAVTEVSEDITVHEGGRYSLNRRLVSVDLWEVRDSLQTLRSTADPAVRATALQRLIDHYIGHLAPESTGDWLEAPREQLRRDVLDALSAEARGWTETDPAKALGLLEHARLLDPYNEPLYRAIVELQAALGRYDEIPRTVGLLTTKLAEIDEEPSLHIIQACENLQRLSD